MNTKRICYTGNGDNISAHCMTADHNDVILMPTHGISNTWFLVMVGWLALLSVISIVSARKYWIETGFWVAMISFITSAVFGFITYFDHDNNDGTMYRFTYFYHWAPWLAVAFLAAGVVFARINILTDGRLDQMVHQHRVNQLKLRAEKLKERKASKSRRSNVTTVVHFVQAGSAPVSLDKP